MAITIGENTFVDLPAANLYFATRIDTDAWDTAVDNDKEKALMTASMLLNDFPYIGVAVSDSQALTWPRSGAVYLDPAMGRLITISEAEYPKRLVRATCELAMHILLNENLMDNTEQTFESIKVGSIQLSDSASDFKPVPVIPSIIKKIIRPLLNSKGSTSWWRAN
jgi:hypothetical protein